MNYLSFKNSLYEGLEFHKPNVISTILKIDENGFTYSIGKVGNYKKISFEVLEAAFHELSQNDSFSKKWFSVNFPNLAKTASCNFTTIGGLMQHFGLATYKRGTYIKEG